MRSAILPGYVDKSMLSSSLVSYLGSIAKIYFVNMTLHCKRIAVNFALSSAYVIVYFRSVIEMSLRAYCKYCTHTLIHILLYIRLKYPPSATLPYCILIRILLTLQYPYSSMITLYTTRLYGRVYNQSVNPDPQGQFIFCVEHSALLTTLLQLSLSASHSVDCMVQYICIRH